MTGNALDTLGEATDGWPTPNRYTDALARVAAVIETARLVESEAASKEGVTERSRARLYNALFDAGALDEGEAR